MKMKRIVILLAVFSIITFACEYKKGLLPVTAKSSVTPGACDTVTYTKQIQPILTANCAIPHCHNSITIQSGYDLSAYADCKTIATNGRLKIRAIDNSDPLGPMPSSGLLSQAQLDLLLCWVNNGALQ